MQLISIPRAYVKLANSTNHENAEMSYPGNFHSMAGNMMNQLNPMNMNNGMNMNPQPMGMASAPPYGMGMYNDPMNTMNYMSTPHGVPHDAMINPSTTSSSMATMNMHPPSRPFWFKEGVVVRLQSGERGVLQNCQDENHCQLLLDNQSVITTQLGSVMPVREVVPADEVVVNSSGEAQRATVKKIEGRDIIVSIEGNTRIVDEAFLINPAVYSGY